MIRPRAARWFEVLCARDDVTLVLEALARTDAVELESRTAAPSPLATEELRQLLGEFAALARRYRLYWPERALAPSPFPQPPAMALRRALEQIRAWAEAAEPLIVSLQALAAERQELDYWQRLVSAGVAGGLREAAAVGPLLAARMVALPADGDIVLPERSLARTFRIDGERHLLVIAPEPDMRALEEQAAAVQAGVHRIPPQIAGGMADPAAWTVDRREQLDRAAAADRAALAALENRHPLNQALGDAGRLQWMIEHVRAVDASPLFAWVCGWTSEPSGVRLAEALSGCRARALLHFPPPPADRRPPLLLSNPRWARPYEVFTRAMGTPSGAEADPSVLLTVIVPLLFGYMFADVGQGALLVLAGAWLRRRLPILQLLVPGGVAAMAFGLLFGSVFSVHGAFRPLWVDPLAQPITVLAVPLVFGASLVFAGFLIQGLEAFWAGQLRRWSMLEAAHAVVFAALVTAVADSRALWLAATGVLAAALGAAIETRAAGRTLAALGELAEKTLQASINTLSFARVGAFALAHAGLSAAIAGLMDAADSTPVKALVLVLGNVVVIALEALIVSIQTTRLVLFEFFTRFLRAEGRPFRALPLPPVSPREI